MTYGPYRKYSTQVLKDGGDRVTLTPFGAVVLDWVVAHQDREFHLLDGYASDREITAQHGARNAIMAPFSNRIKDARYTFRGKEYDFGPNADGVRERMHGLVLTANFEVIEASESAVVYRTRAGRLPAYPWLVEVEVSYRLKVQGCDHRLELDTRVTNLSDSPAPVTIGWHPYINYEGGNTELTRVSIPAATAIVSAADLIPLSGQAAFAAVDSPVEFVNPSGLDNGFTNLLADEDGVVRGRLGHSAGSCTEVEYRGVSEVAGQGLLHVYTGETVPDRPCQSFAMEPCLFMTNAFNRAELVDLVSLNPSATRVLSVAIVHRYPSCT